MSRDTSVSKSLPVTTGPPHNRKCERNLSAIFCDRQQLADMHRYPKARPFNDRGLPPGVLRKFKSHRHRQCAKPLLPFVYKESGGFVLPKIRSSGTFCPHPILSQPHLGQRHASPPASKSARVLGSEHQQTTASTWSGRWQYEWNRAGDDLE